MRQHGRHEITVYHVFGIDELLLRRLASLLKVFCLYLIGELQPLLQVGKWHLLTQFQLPFSLTQRTPHLHTHQ